jgi:hypothetical protein
MLVAWRHGRTAILCRWEQGLFHTTQGLRTGIEDMPAQSLKESTMSTTSTPSTLMYADRRYGCRGGEIAINMQRRETPCC